MLCLDLICLNEHTVQVSMAISLIFGIAGIMH